VRPKTRYTRSGEVYVAYQVFGDGPFDLVVVPGAHHGPLLDMPASASRYVAERISGARFVELPVGDPTFWGGDFADYSALCASS